MSQVKIGAAQAAVVMARGAQALRTSASRIEELEAERDTLLAKVASFEREHEVEAIAKEMEEKGLNAGLTFEEKVASVRGAQDLGRVRDAVKMASTGSIRIAQVSDAPGRGALDPLTAFALGAE